MSILSLSLEQPPGIQAGRQADMIRPMFDTGEVTNACTLLDFDISCILDLLIVFQKHL